MSKLKSFSYLSPDLIFSMMKYLCVQTKPQTGGRLPPGRSAPKCVKRMKGKKGGPDRVDLLVLIDLVRWKELICMTFTNIVKLL